MSNVRKQIISLKTTLWVNSFIYYFKRLWLIGKWMLDSLYSNYALKHKLSLVAFVIRQLIELAAAVSAFLCPGTRPASDRKPAILTGTLYFPYG